MTEDEAKTKWCPFVRVSIATGGQDTYAVNRIAKLDDKDLVGNTPGTRCIASECMAWRWNPEGHIPNKGKQGYCGLAGKP